MDRRVGPHENLLQFADGNLRHGLLAVDGDGRRVTGRLARDDRRRNDAQHVPTEAFGAGGTAARQEIVVTRLAQRPVGHFIDAVAPREIADRGDGRVVMLVAIRIDEDVVADDAARFAELAHRRQRNDFTRLRIFLRQFLQHEQLVLQQIVRHVVDGRAREQRHAFRMAFSGQRRRTAVAPPERIADVARLSGLAAAFQRDRLRPVGEEIAALPRRHARAVEDVAVACRVDDDFRGDEFAAGFRIDDDAFAVAAFHHGRGGDAVEQQLDAFTVQQIRQLQRENLRRIAVRVAFVRRLLRLSVLPFLRQRVETDLHRQAEKLLAHAEDDLLATAVAKRFEIVDEADGRQTAEQRRLLQQQDVLSRAFRRQRGRHAGHAAARHQDIDVFTDRQFFNMLQHIPRQSRDLRIRQRHGRPIFDGFGGSRRGRHAQRRRREKSRTGRAQAKKITSVHFIHLKAPVFAWSFCNLHQLTYHLRGNLASLNKRRI